MARRSTGDKFPALPEGTARLAAGWNLSCRLHYVQG